MEVGQIAGMIQGGGGGGMGGGMSGGQKARMSVDIAAAAQDEIAAYLEPLLVRNELRKALRDARGETRQGYDEAMGYQQPYYDKGLETFKTLSDLYNSGQLNVDVPQWDDAQFAKTWQSDPGYAFRVNQGNQAIEASAAARGSLLSSGTIKALQKYGSDLASQEYDKVYNRAYNRTLDEYEMRNQQAANRFNYGNTLAGYGERAGERLTNLRTEKGLTLADIAMQRGNVEAGMLHGIGNAAHLQAQNARAFADKHLGGSGSQPWGYQQQQGYAGGGTGGGSGGNINAVGDDNVFESIMKRRGATSNMDTDARYLNRDVG